MIADNGTIIYPFVRPSINHRTPEIEDNPFVLLSFQRLYATY